MALAVALVAAPVGSAATTFGSNCTAEGAGVKTFVQLARLDSNVKVQTTSPGVVTSWSVTAGAQPSRTMKLKIFKGPASELETIAESEAQTITPSQTNVFKARIPVPTGAMFGGYSSSGMLFCNGESGDTMGYIDQETSVGSKMEFSVDPTHVIPLTVTVEPDVDGDGFGDETQDLCPQSAATHGACPVTVPQLPAQPGGGGGGGGGSFGLTLRAKLEGNVVAVQITGSANGTVSVSDTLRGRPVAGPKDVTIEAGQIARAYLPLSQVLKLQLAKLPRKRSLNLVIEAKGRSASGASGSASTELALAGRKKPHRRPHRHAGG